MKRTTLAAAPIAALSLTGAAVTAHAQNMIGSGAIADVWAANCMNCHGERGEGGGAGTSSLLDDEFLAGGSDRELFDSIKRGLPDSGMPAYGETMRDPQIWALVVYIRELQYRDRREREGSPRPVEGVYRSQHASFRVEDVIPRGLRTPWSIAFLPASSNKPARMLVTERPGPVRVFDAAKPGEGEEIVGTPAVRARGQGGMMDVAPHPDYAENGWIYLCFSDRLDDDDGRNLGMTKVVRGRLDESGGGLSWVNEETIFEARPEHYGRSDIHFGCRLVFQRADNGRWRLFFPIGERGSGELAQNLGRPNGKIFRLWDDGRIPDDNPFIGREDVYEAIWSYGHRNPQGLVFDLEGRLWDTEHGPRGGDELNLVEKGRNYGWPIVSFGMNYNGAPWSTPWPPETGKHSDIAMPAFVWLPSIGACGLDVVQGDAFPAWRGDLVAGGLSGQNVDRIRIDGAGKVIQREELVHKLEGKARVRDVVCGPDGRIYLVLNQPDKVVRLVEVRQ